MSSVSRAVSKEDFESVGHAIIAVNTTTKTEIKDPNLIEVVEYSSTSLTIRVPKNSCSDGHQLMLILVEKTSKDSLASAHKITVTGKVSLVENVSPNRDMVRIKLIQFVEKDWKEFMKKYSQAQEKVDKILAGYKK